VARAYRNGVIDVAALTADEALAIAAAEPGKHKIILITDFSDGADCILAQPSFVGMAQLKGRRVGVESNAVGGYVLLRALQLHGMSIKDIQPVPLPLDRHVPEFEAGTVDAIVTFEPNRSILLASGARELFTSKEIPGEIVDVIVTRTALLSTRQKSLLHFVQGWFKGLAYIQHEPQEAARRSAIHEHTAHDSFLASLQGVALVDHNRNRQLLSDVDGIEPALTKLVAMMNTNGLLATPIDLRGLTDNTLVEQAQ
jgi:NitT/TauT family transport system substrate-binding protein